MPKLSERKKSPAGIIGMWVTAAPTAMGEMEDTKKSSLTNSVNAKANARAENRTADERSEIALKSANAR